MARGGKRQGAGRKPKSDEQKLVQSLSPLEPLAQEALKAGLIDHQSWAVKLWYEYTYGKPKQRVEMQANIIELANLPEWMNE